MDTSQDVFKQESASTLARIIFSKAKIEHVTPAARNDIPGFGGSLIVVQRAIDFARADDDAGNIAGQHDGNDGIRHNQVLHVIPLLARAATPAHRVFVRVVHESKAPTRTTW